MDVNVQQAALKFELTERTVRRAVKQGRLRHERNDQSELVIPDDEIAPLRKAFIQSFLWVVIKAKNDPNSKPDISKVPPMQLESLTPVFKQLVYRRYLDQITGDEPTDICFMRCRITDLGLDVVQNKRLPGGFLTKEVFQSGFQTLWPLFVEMLPSLLNPKG